MIDKHVYVKNINVKLKYKNHFKNFFVLYIIIEYNLIKLGVRTLAWRFY